MKTYNVMAYGRRISSPNERLETVVETKAESTQAAILQVCGISSKGIQWYSQTYRHELSYLDDVNILGYEVMQ